MDVGNPGMPITCAVRTWIIALAASFFLATFAPSSKAQNQNAGGLRTPRSEHTATLLYTGKVLIAGGYFGLEVFASTELYDPKEGVFVPCADMATGRMNHTATLLCNGNVLVVGGQCGGRTLDSAEIYHPRTGAWTATGSLNLSRAYHTATLLANGDVLVAGGSHYASPPGFPQGAMPGSALGIAEIYDPHTGKWTETDKMNDARYLHSAALLANGQVLVVGGLGSGGAEQVLASAELFDLKTKSWVPTGSLPGPLLNQTETVLRNGRVLVAGGKPTVVTDSASAELYDPSTGTWATTGSLPLTTNAHKALLLPDGKVLATGGANESGATAAAEVYAPDKGVWTPAPNLKNPHMLHTVTLLPNGKILVVGGAFQTGDPNFVGGSAELYMVALKADPESEPKPALPGVD